MHYSTFLDISHFFVHSPNCMRSVFTIEVSAQLPTCPIILLSSANFQNRLFTFSSISFINIINNIGPRTEPCGTPLVTSTQSNTHPLRTTLCFLPFNHSSIHCLTLPCIPISCNLYNSLLCETLSKAFCKSKKNMSTGSFSSTCSNILSIKCNKFVRHDFLLRDPC